jgi:hypothetical protein
MSARIYPDGADPATYRGLSSVYEFINCDGEYQRFNCGQAAACTLLTHYRVFPTDLDCDAARDVMEGVEDFHPPDNAGGWFGTSRRRVERICRVHGVPVEEVTSEDELRQCLENLRPVMVMVGTEGPRIWRWNAPAGHWMVAYGYDANQIFLTNWCGPGMPWPEFRRRWGAIVPRLISMHNRGLVAVTQLADARLTPGRRDDRVAV